MAGFKSTASPPRVRTVTPYDQFLVDPTSGAPIGIVNPQGGGQDGQFYPIPLTAAQIASPNATVLADVSSTYCLNVAPYTRYMSNGTALVGLESGGSVETDPIGIFANQSTVPVGMAGLIIDVNAQAVIYGTFTVQNAAGVEVDGTLRVYPWP